MKRLFGFLAALYALFLPTQVEAGYQLPAPVPDEVPIALLMDLSSGQALFARNIDRRFVPASMAKAMTVYTAFELIASGKLDPRQHYAFTEAAAKDWRRTGSTMFLEPGQQTRAHDLLMGITTVSANDGAIALAEGAAGSVPAWIALMNENARQLGMTQSHFGNPNGFPDGGKTFTTARDLVTLGRGLTIGHSALYGRYFGHRGLRTNGFAQDNHDPLTGRVEGADGIKTGFTRQAGFGFLGSAERGGRRLVMVVAGAPDEALRDKTARALIEWGFAAFESKRLFDKGSLVGTVKVQEGASNRLALTAAQNINVAIPRGPDSAITLAIAYEGPLRAPVRAGEPVAELVITVEGMAPSRVPLVAAESIARAGFLHRIRNAFVELLS